MPRGPGQFRHSTGKTPEKGKTGRMTGKCTTGRLGKMNLSSSRPFFCKSGPFFVCFVYFVVLSRPFPAIEHNSWNRLIMQRFHNVLGDFADRGTGRGNLDQRRAKPGCHDVQPVNVAVAEVGATRRSPACLWPARSRVQCTCPSRNPLRPESRRLHRNGRGPASTCRRPAAKNRAVPETPCRKSGERRPPAWGKVAVFPRKVLH